VRSTAAPYTESRLTRSVANERVGFPVVEQMYMYFFVGSGRICLHEYVPHLYGSVYKSFVLHLDMSATACLQACAVLVPVHELGCICLQEPVQYMYRTSLMKRAFVV
jgi:hypothetical protein